ncbi:MAG: glycosyltransferase family 2 protein [Lachnospiraceae bacterium]|nr:glycosyltransferase family 2 protein [Lachnospiraceae bacterium]
MISYSIVVPVYNAEETLPRLCRSIEKQTYAPAEVLFIEDCSTDHSRSWLEEAVQRHPGWKLLTNEKNSGVSACRNRGIRNAGGTHLLFLDADDWIEPDLLQRASESIRQDQPDVLVFGIAEDFLERDGKISYSAIHEPKRALSDRQDPKDLSDTLLDLEEKTLYGYPWNKVYRTAFLQKNEITFPAMSFAEDFFFNRSVFDLAQTVAVIPDILYHYINVDQDDRLTEKYLPDYFDIQKKRYQEFLDQQKRLRGEEGDLSMIAGRYFRSFASMTARELNHGTPKDQIQSMIEKEMQESSLYQKLRQSLSCPSHITKFLYQPFCDGKPGTALRRMALFCWGKRQFPNLYHKLKQIR